MCFFLNFCGFLFRPYKTFPVGRFFFAVFFLKIGRFFCPVKQLPTVFAEFSLVFLHSLASRGGVGGSTVGVGDHQITSRLLRNKAGDSPGIPKSCWIYH